MEDDCLHAFLLDQVDVAELMGNCIVILLLICFYITVFCGLCSYILEGNMKKLHKKKGNGAT